MHEPLVGYRRPDGSIGIRNHLLILPTVICANQVCGRAAELVPEAVTIPHPYGCSQVGDDAERTFNILMAMGRHPNVGAVLVVGLGCEVVEAQRLGAAIAETGKPVEVLTIQESGGSIRAIQVAAKAAERLAAILGRMTPEPVPVAALTVAVHASDYDPSVLQVTNPAIGRVVDRLVEAGANVVMGGLTDLIGVDEGLAGYCASPDVAGALLTAVNRYAISLQRHGVRLSVGDGLSHGMGQAELRPAAGAEGAAKLPLTARPLPVAEATAKWEQNHWGRARRPRTGEAVPAAVGLAALAKVGGAKIQGLLAYGSAVTAVNTGTVGAVGTGGAGCVWVMETPADDVEAITGLVAGGAQIALVATGQGHPTGSPIAPVVKISANAASCRLFADHIDVDLSDLKADQHAGRVWQGLMDAAQGQLTKAELLGHQEFCMARAGITL